MIEDILDAEVINDLRPGAHFIYLADPAAGVMGRQHGLELRDTMLVLCPEGEIIAFLYRKPLEGTVAENILRHGIGALNISRCRVGTEGGTRRDGLATKPNDAGWENMRGHGVMSIGEGRWPTNLVLVHGPDCVHEGTRRFKPTNGSGVAVNRNKQPGTMNSWLYKRQSQVGEDRTYLEQDGSEAIPSWTCEPGCPVAALDEQSGDCSSPWIGNDSTAKGRTIMGRTTGSDYVSDPYRDAGGASRFFPQFANHHDLRDWLLKLIGLF